VANGDDHVPVFPFINRPLPFVKAGLVGIAAGGKEARQRGDGIATVVVGFGVGLVGWGGSGNLATSPANGS
jgi:hypothetical protein